MKCQILFSGKNKKNITNLLSAEFADSMVISVNVPFSLLMIQGCGLFWSKSLSII